MNKTVFSQIMDYASRYQFDYLVKKEIRNLASIVVGIIFSVCPLHN
jgi:hypothetical protein